MCLWARKQAFIHSVFFSIKNIYINIVRIVVLGGLVVLVICVRYVRTHAAVSSLFFCIYFYMVCCRRLCFVAGSFFCCSVILFRSHTRLVAGSHSIFVCIIIVHPNKCIKVRARSWYSAKLLAKHIWVGKTP